MGITDTVRFVLKFLFFASLGGVILASISLAGFIGLMVRQHEWPLLLLASFLIGFTSDSVKMGVIRVVSSIILSTTIIAMIFYIPTFYGITPPGFDVAYSQIAFYTAIYKLLITFIPILAGGAVGALIGGQLD